MHKYFISYSLKPVNTMAINTALHNMFKTAVSIIVATAVFLTSCNHALAISVLKEKEIAVEFMDAIEEQGKLIQDPMALALVSEIGERILRVVPPQPFRYSFYIMDEDQFNAFAGPGANIFVHRGLITSLDNIDELAGIIGHEIAHASCRHISDMVDQSKIMTIGTLAGVLAGVLVGATGGGSGGDLGQAVLMGSVAAGHTAMLAYSREHETEADQKGLVYLQQAGFNPSGLLTGLEKIRSTDWFGSESIPDYLKTHPGSAERIVQIQSWIEGRGKEINEKNSKNRTGESNKNNIDPFRFKMVKYRLAALYGNEDETEKMFNETLKKDSSDSAAQYGMALLMERENRLKESMEHLRKALEARAFDPYMLMEMGKINILLGEPQRALQIMQGLQSIPEVETEVSFYISQAMLTTGMTDTAEDGFQKVVDTAPDLFPKAYYYLAQINGNKGEKALSHYYLGLYYYEIKNIKSAKFHLLKSLETLSEEEKKKHAQTLLIKSEIKNRELKRKKN